MTDYYTPTGWRALFAPEPGSRRQGELPVEAWSGNGEALVVDPGKGQLVPARTVRGFLELQRTSRIVAVLPAGEGWEVEVPAQAGDPAYREPVIGWVVDDEGEAEPIVPVSGDGNATSAPPGSGRALLWRGKPPEMIIGVVSPRWG